jgi:phage shock protein A
MSQEDALKDEEFLSYQSAYNDATSTLSAKEENLADLEARVESMQQSVTDYTLQAQELAREVDQLRSERHEAEADARLSKEFDSINESLAGISTSGADHDLVELRRDVAKSRGRAKASAKIAKVDVSTQRAKLREAARSKVSNKEFLKSIGVETTPTKITPSSPSKEKASETPPQQQAQPELND